MNAKTVLAALLLAGAAAPALAADPYPYDAHPVPSVADRQVTRALAQGIAPEFWEQPVDRERYHEVVRPLQEKLKEMGCYDLKIDGITGSHTVRGIKTWQALNGAPVNGIVSEPLVQAVMTGGSDQCKKTPWAQ